MYFLSKRIFDIFISIFALIFLFPLFVIVVIILKLTGDGEVFYLQERLGYQNKKFKIIKFATMVKNSPNIGTGSLTIKDDPRVLPFGKYLRKSKINELPQIFNVIIGEMSIVGPRPQMEIDYNKFPKNKRDLIYKSVPGITGIGSIIFRDEESWISNYNGDKHEFYKNRIAPYKTELEIWYLKNSSFIVDILIIIITAWVILYPKSLIYEKVFKNLPKRPTHLNF
tara:strand:- start:1861 stop:2535 length:675 start_codon:yes stop_codon:yes gene_type:complete